MSSDFGLFVMKMARNSIEWNFRQNAYMSWLVKN